MTTAGPDGTPRERRVGIPRPGSDPDTWAGLMKINMSTGRDTPISHGRAPGNGAVLTTAGDLVFWGDLDHKFRAFDAESGQGAVGADAERPDPEQHDHLRGERQAVRGGDHRQGLIDRRADRPGRHQAEPGLQRAVRLRTAVMTMRRRAFLASSRRCDRASGCVCPRRGAGLARGVRYSAPAAPAGRSRISSPAIASSPWRTC